MSKLTRSATLNAPASEPLSEAEVKKHLEIAATDTAHDAQIADLIQSAREQWERDTQRITVSRTIVENFNSAAFIGNKIKLNYRPVISITSIKYYDTANAQQTLASSVYSADIPNRLIHLAYDQDWESTVDRWDAVEVTYVAGYTTTPELDKAAMKLLVYIEFGDDNPAALERYQRAYENMVRRNMRTDYP